MLHKPHWSKAPSQGKLIYRSPTWEYWCAISLCWQWNEDELQAIGDGLYSTPYRVPPAISCHICEAWSAIWVLLHGYTARTLNQAKQARIFHILLRRKHHFHSSIWSSHLLFDPASRSAYWRCAFSFLFCWICWSCIFCSALYIYISWYMCALPTRCITGYPIPSVSIQVSVSSSSANVSSFEFFRCSLRFPLLLYLEESTDFP
jgi:hypothetical protein